MAKKEQKIKFKKAPGAPRRFKSAYMFFSEHQHKAIRSQMADKKLRAAVVAKMVSQAWKALSEDDRHKWIEMGRLDRERYEQEKKNYKGPWKIPDVKNPNAPKKPMSSFLAFSNERRGAIAQANPQMNGTELSCLLAKLWKECPEQVKQQYKERELKEREMFKKCRADWEQRQQLAAKVAKWTEEMPSGQDLCLQFQMFMDDDDQEETSWQGTDVVASIGDEASRVVSVPSSPVLSAAMVPNMQPSSFPTSSLDIDDTPLPFAFQTWSQNVQITPESELSILPKLPNQVLSTSPWAGTTVSATAASIDASTSSPCYDHYSLDDILQDEELFEDFSPRDVPKVPLVNTAWNPTPMPFGNNSL